MKKVFISQPMSGLSDEEIERTRDFCIYDAEKITGEKLREVPSFFKNDSLTDINPVRCLGRSIQLMSEADYVYFAEGWEKARGCRIEHDIAEKYNLNIIMGKHERKRNVLQDYFDRRHRIGKHSS